MKKGRLNIGLYLRKSSGKEDNINLQNQKVVGIRFCEENKFNYEIYSEVISGGKLERKEFNNMIRDCEEGKLDGVWVFKYDRLERNMESMILFRNICIKYGIQFWVGNEKYNLNDSSDRLNIGFRSLISEDERYRIRDRMVRGKKFKLKEGKYILGKMRYGYDVLKGDIFINKEKSNIVKWIYKIFLYKNVKTYSEVELRLNNRVGKGEKVLGVNKIREILKNNLYSDGFVKMTFVGEEYTFNIDKIVTPEDNVLVKEKIKYLLSLRKRKDSEDDFLLKGKIFCGDCKNIMWVVGSNMKRYYRYYSCSVEVNKINLRNKINLEKVDEIVWDSLFEVLLNSKNILSEYKKKYKEGKVNEKNYKNKIIFYEKKKEDRINEFVELIKKFDMVGDVEELIKIEKKKYKKDILEYDKNILEMKEYIDRLELLDNKDLIEEKVKDDMMLIYGNKRIKDRKRFLDKYIDKVYVKRKKEGRKELIYDISIEFKIDIEVNKKNNKDDNNNNNGEVIMNETNKNIYKLNNRDINTNILVYKTFRKCISIKLNLNVLLFNNKNKNYSISYLKSEIFYDL